MILVPQERIDHYVQQGWWGGLTLAERFLETAERQPDALAVADAPNRLAISGQAPERWSWLALLTQVGRWTAWLQAQGLHKDDVLVMQLPNCVDMHAVYLACAVSGIVVSPVPVQYRAHELLHVLRITQARVAITNLTVGGFAQARMWANLAEAHPEVPRVWSLGQASAPDWPVGVSPIDRAGPCLAIHHISAARVDAVALVAASSGDDQVSQAVAVDVARIGRGGQTVTG